MCPFSLTSPAAAMKAGQSSSSWTSGRSLTFGGSGQAPPSTAVSVDGVSFSEGDLLLQVAAS